jgi:hypothetical protein
MSMQATKNEISRLISEGSKSLNPFLWGLVTVKRSEPTLNPENKDKRLLKDLLSFLSSVPHCQDGNLQNFENITTKK